MSFNVSSPLRLLLWANLLLSLLIGPYSSAKPYGPEHLDPPADPPILSTVDLTDYKLWTDYDDGINGEAELVLFVTIDWGGSHGKTVYIKKDDLDLDNPFPEVVISPSNPSPGIASHVECSPAAVPWITYQCFEMDEDVDPLAAILTAGGFGGVGVAAGVLAGTGITVLTVGTGVLVTATGAAVLYVADYFNDNDPLALGTDFTVTTTYSQVALPWGPCSIPAPAGDKSADVQSKKEARMAMSPPEAHRMEEALRYGVDDDHPLGKSADYASKRYDRLKAVVTNLPSLQPEPGTTKDVTHSREILGALGVLLAGRPARAEMEEAAARGRSAAAAAAEIALAEADSASGNLTSAIEHFRAAAVEALRLLHPEFNDPPLREIFMEEAPAKVAPPPAGVTTYYLYQDACAERLSGTWAPRMAAQADSLNGYAPGTQGSYESMDLSTFLVGGNWRVVAGNSIPTADLCAGGKASSLDHFFAGGDTISNWVDSKENSGFQSCTFPMPAGTADVTFAWSDYFDFPDGSGLVQFAEYRTFRNGVWSLWGNVSPDGAVFTGPRGTWTTRSAPLVEAPGADSVQVRLGVRCLASTSANGIDCTATSVGVLYDDLRLQVTTGTPVPAITIFSGSLPQSTFVDGTMMGLNCTSIPCWPGVRGSDLKNDPDPFIAGSAIDDNFNSPLGDSIIVTLTSVSLPFGMGINWHAGYDKRVDGGRTLVHSNPNFNSNYDTPRLIYRLFDPATKSWSPWDSTALDADDVLRIPVVNSYEVQGNRYRVDWPPRDKLGSNLPGMFTINGQAAYSSLAFLPRGSRVQYYVKAVDGQGGITYTFAPERRACEVADLPTLPNGGSRAPDIMEFSVLPGRYSPGAPGTLAAGKTDTPILNLDGAYTSWSYDQDPVTVALRGLGVRADRYRLLQAPGTGNGVGGHELSTDRKARIGNYFPNLEEYPILDSLAAWYRIIIQSSHLRGRTVFEEQDAQLINNWLRQETGANGGDRCLLLTGDGAFEALTNTPPGLPGARQYALADGAFGVANATSLTGSHGAWAGAASNLYPAIDDRFAASSSGPGLAPPGTFLYEVDGGCPGMNRFDPLTKAGTASAFHAAVYPTVSGMTDVAAVGKTYEWDPVSDLDQSKTLGYGFSLQYVRGTPNSIPRGSPSYAHSGVLNRMQILAKFLTGCRGARTTGSQCWPCPSDANLIGNWALLPGFQTDTYGPLYPIQDFTQATGVEEGSFAPEPLRNQILGSRPNPFNPMAEIRLNVATPGVVRVRIFDVAGRLVRTLEKRVSSAGRMSISWDGKASSGVRAASGVYFYRTVFPDGASLTGPRGLVLLK